MYTHCIIGAGVSGLILLLLLANANVSLDSIVIIDPYFDGGDLARKWSFVISNTPWSTTYNSVKQYLPNLELPIWAQNLALDKPTPVFEIARLLQELAYPLFNKIKIFHGIVTRAQYGTSWAVCIQMESHIEIIESTNIYFTVGSNPTKSMNSILKYLTVPTIQLKVALNIHNLRQYIQPNDKVIVFGTSHSGVLILKNLADCGANAIGVYKGDTPFYFARDGVYNGIKLDAAQYADEIMQCKYPRIKFIKNPSVSDIELISPKWCIYATGFQQRKSIHVEVNCEGKDIAAYSAITGKLIDCPNAWGFGIAYPSQAPDGVHFDVGVSSFFEHIANQLINLKYT